MSQSKRMMSPIPQRSYRWTNHKSATQTILDILFKTIISFISNSAGQQAGLNDKTISEQCTPGKSCDVLEVLEMQVSHLKEGCVLHLITPVQVAH
jgi:hypothetical protein